ncbi:MAG: acetate--CoA ligase family protein [Desulfobacterales bacterium]|nr:acetate--CoA ligase family protein [Desulfobacterales bacterium]
MEPTDVIDAAIRRNAKTLNEAEAKCLLASHGVPVVAEAVVRTAPEAVRQAALFGFPVVMKGLGARLTHKSDRGLVALDLRSEAEVGEAFARIRDAAGSDWEGCLVQALVPGRREFAAGFFRDPQFGPVVMFGLGGIFAEAFEDVVFRMPPLSRAEIDGMIEALACRKLLSDFRGETAVDRVQLVQALTGMCRLGAIHSAIKEIDINPLIVQPDGKIVAVDALIGLDTDHREESDRNRVSRDQAAIDQAIDQMVHPESIAVVGARRAGGNSLSGADLFKQLQDFGFPGRLYPINPRASETIHGCKAYPDLFSLPEIPDHVIISVPAKFVPGVLSDCAAVGIKNIHIFTAGFKETGEEEGLQLQVKIEDIAQKGGLHVIGPNCMGLYVPGSRMVTWPEAPARSGPVAFISQSGGHARDFTKLASSRFGIHFSVVVSYGNALTLDGTDFLRYAAKDDQTRVILMYLEGIADGRAFFDVVRQVSLIKPVIILKAGLTDAGVRVAASHTGALAGSRKIWDAFFCQSGAVRATSLNEMAAFTQSFLHLKKCPGRRVAILGSGGGISVNAADACTSSGLILPAFPPGLFTVDGEPMSTAGNIITNPIDAHRMFFDLPLLGRMIKRLTEGSHVDMYIVFLQLDWLFTDSGRDVAYLEKIATYIATEGKRLADGNPLVVAWRRNLEIPVLQELTTRIQRVLLNAGVPVYEGISSAVSALSKLAGYHEFINRVETERKSS